MTFCFFICSIIGSLLCVTRNQIEQFLDFMELTVMRETSITEHISVMLNGFVGNVLGTIQATNRLPNESEYHGELAEMSDMEAVINKSQFVNRLRVESEGDQDVACRVEEHFRNRCAPCIRRRLATFHVLRNSHHKRARWVGRG